MAVGLRRFMPHGPLELLRGPVGEWIVLILLCGLFIAIAGAILPKRLTEKRYGKAVTTFVGLILGIGLFMSKKLLNFNLESFGFLAIFIIIILMFLVTYGLLKMQFNKDMAIGITYCMIFLTFYVMTPSLFDAIADSLPILNGIFFLTFFYIIGKTLFNAFRGTGEGFKDKIKSTFIDPSSDDQPIQAFRKRSKKINLKGVTMKSITELKTEYDKIMDELKKLNGWMDDTQAKDTTKVLTRISKTKPYLEKAYEKLTQRILTYKDTSPGLYADLVKDTRDLKDRLKGFYKLLNEGMEHIKKAAIRLGQPILMRAQDNLNAGVRAVERLNLKEREALKKTIPVDKV